MKKVLITGSTGFVGANLTRRLIQDGYDVSIIIRQNSNTWRIHNILNHCRVFYGDISNYESVFSIVKGVSPDIIYNLAAYAAYPFQQDIEKTINTNFLGTVNLLNACIKHGFENFINTGSSSEYGEKQNSMKETDILNPNSLYAVSKSASTLYCQYIGQSLKLPISTIRLFSVYGYYEEPSRLIPTVISSCIKYQNPKLASGNSVRDFIFIEDVLDTYLLLQNFKNSNGIILNVGTGVQHSVFDVVEKCLEICQSNIVPLWGNTQKRLWDNLTTWVADISKIKEVLNWTPKYDLSSGLNKTINWFNENINYYN